MQTNLQVTYNLFRRMSLKELRNFIFCAICVRPLFCSIQVHISLYFLPILFENCVFCLFTSSALKVLLPWRLLLILLKSAVIYYLKFFLEKQVVQYLLNCKCHRLYPPNFGKLYKVLPRNGEIANLQQHNFQHFNSIIFTDRWIFWLFFVLKCYNFSMNLQLYKSAVPYNKYLWRNIFMHIYVCARSLDF